MTNRRFYQWLFILTLLTGFLGLAQPANASRLPSNKKAIGIISHYFDKYNKKYPGSELGDKVSSVEISSIDELQKNLVSVAAEVKFENGSSMPIRMSLIRKYPLGWRQNGWEKIN